MKPCVGLIEFDSIAIGIQATDAMIKKAIIEVVFSYSVSRGKYFTWINGEVEDVQNSLHQGIEIGGKSVLDQVLIPNLHPDLLPALDTVKQSSTLEAMGIIETQTCPCCIMAADRALKTAAVELVTLHLARGIGGKAYFILAGEVGDLEAALIAGAAFPKERGLLLQEVLIPQADPNMWRVLMGGTTPS